MQERERPMGFAMLAYVKGVTERLYTVPSRSTTSASTLMGTPYAMLWSDQRPLAPKEQYGVIYMNVPLNSGHL